MAVTDIRFKRLGYAALTVTDPARTLDFYTKMVGLEANGADPARDGGPLFLRCSEKNHDLVLFKGPRPGIRRLGWEMESEEAWRAARKHLEGLGLSAVSVARDEAALLGIGDAFRIAEPTTGATFEFYVGMERAPTPYVPSHTKISRLGHVVLRSPDRAATVKFMHDHLNFRVSDSIEDTVTFMRCFPNPYHHSFGVVAGEEAGLHHVNLMVSEIDDIGKAIYRMKAGGVPIVFGPGRHPPSESVFLYFLDPDGMTVEYSYGMEEFPEASPREPRLLPRALESVDYWGGVPEEAIGKVGAIESQ